MHTHSGQSGKLGRWDNRELTLLFDAQFVALVALVAWGVTHLPERRVFTGGVVELRESVIFIGAVIALWLAGC